MGRTAAVDVMVRVHSGYIAGDNLWLWRADHAMLAAGEDQLAHWNLDRKAYGGWAASGEGKGWGEVNAKTYHVTNPFDYRCNTALEVLGDHVTMYGLFAEHTLKDLTVWRGEAGKVFFYQSELP